LDQSRFLSEIRNCAFFTGLEDRSLRPLLKIAEERIFVRGTTIFRQGDPVPGIFIVSEGLVRVFKMSSSGKEHVLHLAGPGRTFAEIAVIAGFPCPAFAEATEDTRCIFLPTDGFLAALRSDHGLCLQLLTGMGLWVRSFLDLMEGIVLKDSISRIAAYLLEQTARQKGNKIVLPSLKKHVASHLNLTSETLSRTLKQLKEAGLIQEEGENSLRVPDLERLRSAADGNFPLY